MEESHQSNWNIWKLVEGVFPLYVIVVHHISLQMPLYDGTTSISKVSSSWSSFVHVVFNIPSKKAILFPINIACSCIFPYVSDIFPIFFPSFSHMFPMVFSHRSPQNPWVPWAPGLAEFAVELPQGVAAAVRAALRQVLGAGEPRHQRWLVTGLVECHLYWYNHVYIYIYVYVYMYICICMYVGLVTIVVTMYIYIYTCMWGYYHMG